MFVSQAPPERLAPPTLELAYAHLLRALPEMPRVWWSVALPGYRDHPTEYATYSAFDYEQLPPIERDLDDQLRWLLEHPPVPRSLAEAVDASWTRASRELLKRVAGLSLTVPPSFAKFLGSHEAHARVRSCTDCHLDLADFVVTVRGSGVLIHFLSDSQWVLHWLLYVGSDSNEAVVVTETPYGFELDDVEGPTVRVLETAAIDAAVCAESFAEFLYRFWIENEIWFSLADPESEPRPLTSEQRRYAEHYL